MERTSAMERSEPLSVIHVRRDEALIPAGHQPKLVRTGGRYRTDARWSGRRRIKRLTGNYEVPTLFLITARSSTARKTSSPGQTASKRSRLVARDEETAVAPEGFRGLALSLAGARRLRDTVNVMSEEPTTPNPVGSRAYRSRLQIATILTPL